jgi:hypothetical protein
LASKTKDNNKLIKIMPKLRRFFGNKRPIPKNNKTELSGLKNKINCSIPLASSK